ncbi:MAG: hypothetical protein AMJ79_06550 [Phycisphaerae bacterium SM23_30]|nr:MAG: hypothetical protein AMJ79_06550 [Phycisphaerae bacterium SM23_30]
MNKHKDEKWLDEQLFRAINVGDLQFDAEKWKEKYPQEYEMLSSSARRRSDASVSRQNIWRTIMTNRIINIAAAAVIIIALCVTLIVTLTTDNVTPPLQNDSTIVMTHVAWGKVIENLQQIETLKHKVFITIDIFEKNRTEDLDFTIHRSAEFGIRRDAYQGDEIISVLYIPAQGNEFVEVLPPRKQYVTGTISEAILEQVKQVDLQLMVTELMKMEYIELGSKTIDGVVAEGIEFIDPKFGVYLFDNGTGELWVDPLSNLPVLLIAEGDTNDGTRHLKLVVDQFEWSTELTAADFEADIPNDYSLWMDVGEMGAEESAIEALQGFAELTNGVYPVKLSIAEINVQLTHVLEAKGIGSGQGMRELTQDEIRKIVLIQSTCIFYAKLVSEENDVAYYGDSVTPADVNKVLMRWQLKSSLYRVVFGDLHTEDVNAKRLAELEGR